jgi:hypothetical protein
MRILRPSEVTSFTQLKYGELTPEELKEAYALARAAFTAEDLQRFTEEDEGLPMEDLLNELEEAQRQYEQKSL